MNDIQNLADTIKPKSDQLNADDLITGPINVTVASVRRGSSDQPVVIDIAGMMPYKPCKSMRRVLISAWGQNGSDWIGKSMTLYNDPSVKFGGVALGGIRISHVSHIANAMSMMLTTTRSKRAQYVIQPLIVDHSEVINKYFSLDEKGQSKMWEQIQPDQKTAIVEASKQNQGA